MAKFYRGGRIRLVREGGRDSFRKQSGSVVFLYWESVSSENLAKCSHYFCATLKKVGIFPAKAATLDKHW